MSDSNDTDQSIPNESSGQQPAGKSKQSTDSGRTINRRQYLTYTGALAGAPVTAGLGGRAASARRGGGRPSIDDLGPARLRVDYEADPENIAPYDETGSNGFRTAPPRFSWDVMGPRGVEQSAYRVLVATSPAVLENGRGDVWDSGEVKSAQSTNVQYGGDTLEPDTTYYWTVQIWDVDGNASDWSEPAQFTTAIPDTDDHWGGEWIGVTHDIDDSLPGEEWTDYTVEAEFTLEAYNAGFIFRASDADNLYMWQVNTAAGPIALLRPHVRVNGGWSVLDEIEIDDVFEGEDATHQIEIEVSGEEIITAIDGTQVDARTDATHSSGTIGFRQHGDEHVQIEWIRVTDLAGDLLFEDDFYSTDENFDGGTIEDGTLNLRGTGVVLRGEPFDLELPGPLLRNEFDVGKEIDEARAHVSGLGYYELYLNGERIGDHVLDPGMTDYEHTILYSSYDVTDQLQDGRNVVGTALGRGRFGEPLENVWNWHDTPWWSDPQLRLQLNIEFADGTSTSVVSDGDWTMTDGPTRLDSLFGGEVYDAREEKPGWTTTEYDDSDWERPEVVTGPSGDFVPQRMQPMRVVDTVEPVAVTELDADTYVFDLGVLVSGWVELTVEGPEGTEVTMIQGEKLHDDGTVNIDTGHLQEPIQTDTYVLAGNGTETWEPRFSYKGVRYVQVENYPGTPTLDDLQARVVHTTIDDGVESRFDSSNELLNRIHGNNHRAFLNNMHGVPTDTPKFEKNGWTGDALVTAEKGIYNFDMARFWRKWLRDCRDAQADAPDVIGEEGNIPVIVPTSDWGYHGWTPDPAWQSAFVLIAWWGYEYYGDERFLKENYEGMQRYLEYLEGYADDGIVRHGLGDWVAPGYPGEPPEAPDIVSTCYYYRDAQVMAQVAEHLGHDDDATAYRKLSEEIRTALNEEYLDEESGYYRSRQRHTDAWLDEYRQTDNVFPLAFEMVPEVHEEAVVDNLVEDVMETHDGHLNTGAHGTKFLLPVLTEYGHHDVAYTVATQTTYPSWGHWIENDMTALLESWELDARSRSHHFLGTVDEWFYKHLAGIQVGEPGFAHVEIAPKPVDDLEWASGRVDTIRGPVTADWELVETPGNERELKGIHLTVSIPGNSTATVEIPVLGGEKVRLREDGKTVWDNGNRVRPHHPGIKDVIRADDRIVVEVGAGQYDFELEQLGDQ